MRFAEPIWLVSGIVACAVLLVLYRLADRQRRRALDRFASHHLVAQLTASLSPGRRRLKRALVLCGVAGLCASLAQPQLGFHWEEAHRQGIDLLFAVDTSRSMLAQDVKPDRLTRAKLAVSDLVEKFDGDRVGLIAFAGDAFLQCPLTLDREVFRESLAALQPGIIPRGGTDLAQAIHEAQAATATEPRNHKILVLLTDGEDLEGRALEAARAAGQDGLRIYTIGVGTPQGELIPVPGQPGQFLRDVTGAFVKSRLDEPMLSRIAEETGGVYRPLGQQGEGLEAVYQHSLALLPKQELASRMHRVYHERYQWPLLLGVLCLMAELLVGERRRRGAALRAAERQRATGFQQVALAVACLAVPVAAQASPQSAERAYKQGDYATAAKEYAQAAGGAPGKSELQFNLGAAAYKSGRYDQAAAAFDKALRAERVELQEQSYYDLGNTQYRAGEKLLREEKQKTIEAWKQAIASYEAALKLRQEDADAKFNRDFVQRRLEELQKQQQTQNQQKKQDKGQQDQKKQGQGGGQGQQDQQAKNQQGMQNQNGQGQQDQQAKNQQGQQQQSQGGQGQQDQQAKNQQGQQQQAQNQPQQAKNQQGRQQQNQTGQGQQDQQAKNQQGQQQQPAQQPQLAGGQEPPPGEQEPGHQPGQMTRAEANSLFDSLRDQGRRLPFASDTRSGSPRQEQQPSKDW